MHADLEAMFTALRGAYSSASEREVIDTWERLFEGSEASGTLRSWMQEHDGEQIDTFQYDRHTSRPWVPGVRTLDATRATFFELGGSRRDYAGMIVLASTPDHIAAADSGGWQICLYTRIS